MIPWIFDARTLGRKMTAFPLYFVVLSLYAQLILAEGFVSLLLKEFMYETFQTTPCQRFHA